MNNFDLPAAKWFFEPMHYLIEKNRVTITTDPNTDFWQRTYYGFRNDNAHVLYHTTEEQYFSFEVKVSFDYSTLFDQCGIAVYQDSDTWAKAGIEFHDGKSYNQMRIFHLDKSNDKVNFGLYACSPGNSTFDAVFTDIAVFDCVWAEHN